MSIELDHTLLNDPVYDSQTGGTNTLTFYGTGADYVAGVLSDDRERREQREREDAIEALVRKHAESLAHRDISASSLFLQLNRLAEEIQHMVTG